MFLCEVYRWWEVMVECTQPSCRPGLVDCCISSVSCRCYLAGMPTPLRLGGFFRSPLRSLKWCFVKAIYTLRIRIYRCGILSLYKTILIVLLFFPSHPLMLTIYLAWRDEVSQVDLPRNPCSNFSVKCWRCFPSSISETKDAESSTCHFVGKRGWFCTLALKDT